MELHQVARHRPTSYPFQLLAKSLDGAGEFSVTNFEMIGDECTDAPSSSVASSSSPTRLDQKHLGHVVKYVGEVRTVVRAPLQIDKTEEVLQTTPGKEYQLWFLLASPQCEGVYLGTQCHNHLQFFQSLVSFMTSKAWAP